jgi:hypothetical protein
VALPSGLMKRILKANLTGTVILDLKTEAGKEYEGIWTLENQSLEDGRFGIGVRSIEIKATAWSRKKVSSARLTPPGNRR